MVVVSMYVGREVLGWSDDHHLVWPGVSHGFNFQLSLLSNCQARISPTHGSILDNPAGQTIHPSPMRQLLA